jgi:hypothetical protein
MTILVSLGTGHSGPRLLFSFGLKMACRSLQPQSSYFQTCGRDKNLCSVFPAEVLMFTLIEAAMLRCYSNPITVAQDVQCPLLGLRVEDYSEHLD